MPRATNARARVRAEITREIAEAGRAELAAVGAPALSLRAIARRMGMAPSALYRYFDSRDHLLTALIVDAYDAVAAAAAKADRAAGEDSGDRWLAVARGIRRWSARHPHEWALVFGTPVPGYVGSEATSAAALGLHRLPFDIVQAAARRGELGPPADHRLGESAAGLLDAQVAELFPEVAEASATAALSAWGQVIGVISLERFGHFTGVVRDLDAYFDHCACVAAGLAGLRVSTGPAIR